MVNENSAPPSPAGAGGKGAAFCTAFRAAASRAALPEDPASATPDKAPEAAIWIKTVTEPAAPLTAAGYFFRRSIRLRIFDAHLRFPAAVLALAGLACRADVASVAACLTAFLSTRSGVLARSACFSGLGLGGLAFGVVFFSACAVFTFASCFGWGDAEAGFVMTGLA